MEDGLTECVYVDLEWRVLYAVHGLSTRQVVFTASAATASVGRAVRHELSRQPYLERVKGGTEPIPVYRDHATWAVEKRWGERGESELFASLSECPIGVCPVSSSAKFATLRIGQTDLYAKTNISIPVSVSIVILGSRRVSDGGLPLALSKVRDFDPRAEL